MSLDLNIRTCDNIVPKEIVIELTGNSQNTLHNQPTGGDANELTDNWMFF